MILKRPSDFTYSFGAENIINKLLCMIVFQQMKSSNLLLCISFPWFSHSKFNWRHCRKTAGGSHLFPCTHACTRTQSFKFHLPRKAPQTPLFNSSPQKQSQASSPWSSSFCFQMQMDILVLQTAYWTAQRGGWRFPLVSCKEKAKRVPLSLKARDDPVML